MDGWQRVGLSIGFLLLAFLLGFHYAPAENIHDPYPDTEELASEYDTYVGERALLFGRVLEVGSDTATIRVRYDGGTMQMTVREFDADVDPGGDVQVYGDLQPGQEITAGRIVVINRASSLTWYKYVASGIGALIILYEFFAYWRIDWSTLGFEVRDG